MSAPAAVPTLSREEMRSRALAFAKRWQGDQREEAEAKSFLDEFFHVFGRDRKEIEAVHEYRINRPERGEGRIDLFWPGILLVEMKSSGKDLSTSKGGAAYQAFEYLDNIKPSDLPRWIMVSDFGRFVLYDRGEDRTDKPREVASFTLEQFPDRLRHFAFIRDEEQELFLAQPDVNLKAVKLLGSLHDSLLKSGYTGHALERLLVRVLFCLFAKDTDIFIWNSFTRFVRSSQEDGSDLGLRLGKLFQVLDTPAAARNANLTHDYRSFPYVNGGLFAERLDLVETTEEDRTALIECCLFNWSKISPGIFGSLFQGVMEPAERRAKGAHYTSEENILRVLDPLFMDDLRAEFAQLKTAAVSRDKKLAAFHDKLSKLRFLDPACGCGNFLVVAYRELRRLELEVLQALYGQQLALGLDIADLARLNVDQFFGIEIEEFPALIAETALWLTDHQVNMTFAKAFGQHFARIPLKKSPTIVHGNALRTDWEKVLPPKNCSYVLGNPPFVGKQYMGAEQNADMETICGKIKGFGVLDFVTAWYVKAADYIQGTRIGCAFVSTNSISQGEQPTVLWSHLFRKKIKIHFAHRTFVWANEASGKAHVHVVIIGFGAFDLGNKRLFEYDSKGKQSLLGGLQNINPYLAVGGDCVVTNLKQPTSAPLTISFGNMPNDGGHLLLNEKEKQSLTASYPFTQKWIKPILGPEDFINGSARWCLWLEDANPSELRACPPVLERMEKVKAVRLKSSRGATQKLAATPGLFGEIRQPKDRYLAIPKTSSERREYIPMGFLDAEIIASADLFTCDRAAVFHFGMLTSAMHMAWMRTVAGRLKSDYRYSAGLVYNNFPWPEPDAKQRAAVETAAQAVLDARQPHLNNGATLADLYDPLTMPPELHKAHQTLDRAVDRCYRNPPFTNDRERVEHLFALYEKLTSPLLPANRKAVTYKKKPKAKYPRPLPHMGFQAATDADEGHMDTVHEDAPPYGAK